MSSAQPRDHESRQQFDAEAFQHQQVPPEQHPRSCWKPGNVKRFIQRYTKTQARSSQSRQVTQAQFVDVAGTYTSNENQTTSMACGILQKLWPTPGNMSRNSMHISEQAESPYQDIRAQHMSRTSLTSPTQRTHESHCPDDAHPLPVEFALCGQLFPIISDPDKFQALLRSRQDDLQHLLDFLQHILSLPGVTDCMRRQVLTVLLRLSTASCHFPQSFILRSCTPEGRRIVTSGSFGDIESGFIKNTKVCLKLARRRHEKSPCLKSLMREIVVLGQLNHPNILPLFGILLLEGIRERICLVSPWMENGNLFDYLRAYPSVNRLLLMRDILSGLKYLHSMMIVHGDLKSTNVLITMRERACLGDFGLASISGTEVTRYPSFETTGHQGATVRFEAPELLLHTSTDKIHRTAASDVYAVGCIFYEVFTEELPYYEVTTPAAVILRVQEGVKPTKPVGMALNYCKVARGMTDEVWSVMDLCWSRSAERRPTVPEILSMALFKTLEDHRPDEPVHSPPERCVFEYSTEQACQQVRKLISEVRAASA